MHRWQFTVILLLSTLTLAAAPAEEPVPLQGFSSNAARRSENGKESFAPYPLLTTYVIT